MKRFPLKHQHLCIIAVSTLLTVVPCSVQAAQPPDAGRTLEGLKNQERSVPQRQEVKLTVESYKPPMDDANDQKLYVSRFRITGQDLVPEAELLLLVKEGQGRELSLKGLQELAGRISEYFHKKGYILARAYIPAQDIVDGQVEIAVMIGTYGKIVINNQTDVAESAIRRELGKVKSGAYIHKADLEWAIWLINDLAGAEAKAALAPGTAPGTSDLILKIQPKDKKVAGSISIDNYGNRFTGSNQVSVTANINNPNQQGDRLSINGVTTGKELVNGGVTYQLPAFAPGGKLQVQYSQMRYELGEDYAYLDASGTAKTASISYLQTFKRSQKSNLYGEINFGRRRLEDQLQGSTTAEKHADLLNLTITGDSLDEVGGGGANSYSLTVTAGKLSIDNAAARAEDDAYARSAGSYTKVSASFLRQQYINDRLSLMLSVNGQTADKNLDSSEKMSLGGAYGVRAYPKGEASGDIGYLATAELRWTLPGKDPQAGIRQLTAFIDNGSVQINKNTWANAGDNHRTLSGAGVGFIWNRPGDYSLKASYAWKLGNEKAISDTDKNGRLWLQVTKYF